MKKRILTGDRPTSRLHIGHYAGSLENRVMLQDDYEQFIIIADIQALTTHYEKPEILKTYVHELCIDYLSVGIDPEKSHIFVQSMVPQIAELTVIYSMFVTVNSLRHNPTIKTEAKQYGYNDLNYGFLGYPVSQAADITFCNADLVPVGEDQLPVVEVTRKIVRRFNDLYNADITVPETLLGKCPRLSGTDGNSKMSKSMGNAIFLSDDNETVMQKVKSTITDPERISLKDKGNPDICIVYEYHSVFNEGEKENIASMCKNADIGCVACKKLLGDKINGLLEPIRAKRAVLERKPEFIKEVMAIGTKRALIEGKKTMEKVREVIGINY
ncbi:MAG: tryptophan--tRNA ligase [Clostridiales bacterium]|nr:tryptophan--tRNA ligase [Clostridiales bacterium]